jgi:hypothetical protein
MRAPQTSVVVVTNAHFGSQRTTAMGREPGFLEVAALVCTIIAGVLAVADWMLKVI